MNRDQGRSYGLTHPGRIRTENQDGFYLDDSDRLWLVTDGMGGHSGGEIASAMVCQLLPELIRNQFSLDDALRSAHRAVLQRSVDEPALQGLGTTVVLVKENRNRYAIAWSGDSRVYLWNRTGLEQLTSDHSLLQKMMDSGGLSDTRATDHAMKHVISSCLGTTLDKGLEVGLLRKNWHRGDRLLLCTDGLSDLLGVDDMNELLAMNTDISDACQALIEAALQAGAPDNVTAVLVDAPRKAPDLKSRFRFHIASSLFVGASVAMAFLLVLKLALLQS